MNFLNNLIDSIFKAVPPVISAVIMLVVAFLLAYLAKNLVTRGLKRIKAERLTDKLGLKDEKTGGSLEFIGKLVFIIVFLLFLPGVLDKLGMQNVAAPISSFVSQFLNYIPNILAAVIILVVGIYIAKIIRQLIVPLLRRLKIDRLQEKAGIAPAESATISSVVSYVIYVLILIPVIIAALQVLNISAISVPAIAMLDKIIVFLPNIIVALAIIILGIYIAKIAGKLLSDILASVGTDALTSKMVTADESKLRGLSLSGVIGQAVRYIIVLLFVVEALNVINLDVLKTFGNSIIAYLPAAVSAIIIMGAALFLASAAEGLIRKKFPDGAMSALAAKSAILVVAGFMALNQLGIATSIVNAAFIIILGAVAVAFAVAFGVGGRRFAAAMLEKFQQGNRPDTETEDKESPTENTNK